MGENNTIFDYILEILVFPLFLFLLQSLLHFLSQLDEITHQVSLCHGHGTEEPSKHGTRESTGEDILSSQIQTGDA